METYLVAVDNSERASHVLATASALARSTGAKLVLLRAVGLPHDLPAEAYATSPDGVVEVLEQRAKRDLDELAGALPSGVAVTTRVEVGSPWQTICHAGKETGAALIVIGSHGYSALDRLLGTTAAKVVNHADRSVLVVRTIEPSDHATRHARPQDG
jgi:nucleotide-binding universal stress UspA family protein